MAEYDLKRSSERIGQIYPVLLDKRRQIIDGFHRKAIDPNWREVVLEHIDTEQKRLLALIHANWHRRAISKDEKRRWLTALCEANPDWDDGEGFVRRLALETGFTTRTIQFYLPKQYQGKRGRKSDNGIRKAFEFRYVNNVWEADPHRPEGYGDRSFEGNTPPLIAREVLLRYTREGDLVFDAMAGSGTILDMCRELKRQCISCDICPIRPDVERGDVRATNFPDAHFDFIFAHFPYWNMHTYSNVEGDLSHMPQDGFRQESRRVMAEACRILKPGKYYAVLIGDQRKDKQIIDWSAEFSLMGQSLFQLHDKIIWYAHGQRAYQGGYYDEWAACYNFCKQTFDTLLIFKKEPPHGHIQQ